MLDVVMISASVTGAEYISAQLRMMMNELQVWNAYIEERG